MYCLAFNYIKMKFFILLAVAVVCTVKGLITIQSNDIPEIPSDWTYEDIKKHTKRSNLGENLCMFHINDYKYMKVEDLKSCYKQMGKMYTKILKIFTSEFNKTLSKYAYELKNQKKGNDVTTLERNIECVIKTVNMCPKAIRDWINNRDERMVAVESIDGITPYRLYYKATLCDTAITIFLKQQIQKNESSAENKYGEVIKIRKMAEERSRILYKELKGCLNSLEGNALPDMY